MNNRAIKRLPFLDFAKGIGIICIVIGHSYSYYKGNGSLLIPYLYSFHVPLFFIVSGIIYSHRKIEKVNIIKKFRELMIPYFIWGSLYQLTLLFLAILGGEDIKSQLGGRIVTVLGLTSGAMWFLPTMFVATVLFLISCRIQKVWIRVLLCLIAFLAGAFAPHNSVVIETLWRGLIGFSFMTIGFCGARLFTKEVKLWEWFGILILDIFIINFNTTCDLARRSFGFLPFYIMLSIMGSWLCISACKYLEIRWTGFLKSKINNLGRFSIIILCTHQIVLTFIQLVDYKLLNNTIQRLGEWEGVIMTAIIITLTDIIMPIYLRYISWSFGFGKKNQIKLVN